tara:strand:+ start:16647 stop:16988 length:342 start_codon:yes stop_codon:yes gene_type:complete
MAVHYLKTYNQQNLKTYTSFNRSELGLILAIYGKKVSQGIWKDYAIDHCVNNAIFSFYRSSYEKAYLQIEKNTKSTKSKLKYRLIDSVGRVLKQDNDLTKVISFLSSSQLKIV